MIIFIGVLLSVIAFMLFSILVIFLALAISTFMELPYVGTNKKKIETIIKLANIKKGETVIDLGSGDGRLLIAAAKIGAHAIGYELNPFLIWLTRIKAYLHGFRGPTSKKNQNSQRSDLRTGSVTIKRQDLWRADLKVADVIFVYAYRKTMPKFEKFIYENAKPGTRIIVNTNPFPRKQPLKSKNGIFLYKI